MIDQELYNRWIEALDHHAPASGQLRANIFSNKFCCLGVLCNISDIGEWDSQARGDPPIYRIDDLASEYYLPNIIQQRINFKTNQGDFLFAELSQYLKQRIATYFKKESSEMPQFTSLATINDDLNRKGINPFPIIKQILQERPPSLFM